MILYDEWEKENSVHIMNWTYEMLMSIFDYTCILLKFSKKKYSGELSVLNELGEGYIKISALRRNFIGNMAFKDMILRFESSGKDFESNIYAKI